MAKIRRFTAFFMALTVALTAFAVPIYATDYQSEYNFWNWAYDHSWFLGKLITGAADNVCAVSEDSLHHSTNHSAGGLVDGEYTYTCICDYCGQTFTAVATNLQETYENETPDYTIDNEGHIYYDAWQVQNYWPNYPMEIVSQVEGMVSAKMTVNFTSPCSAGLYQIVQYDEDTVVNIEGKFVWSRTGTPTEVIDQEVTVKVKIEGGNTVTTTSTDTGMYFTAVAGTQYRIYCSDTSFKSYTGGAGADWHYNVQYVQIYTPIISVSGSPPVITDLPVGSGGSISYVDDNSNNEIIENQFFDQSTNTYHNPVTDTSSTVESWEYDYSTRTYTGHTENGDVFIQYGDENITVTEGNNIYHYYYTAPDGSGGNGGSGGSGDGSDNDGESIWDKLGELLGNLVGGLLDLISGVISGLLDSLIELVSVTLEKLGSIVDLFGSFGDALKSLWSWLPEDIVTILAAGVSVVVFASVIKLFI